MISAWSQMTNLRKNEISFDFNSYMLAKQTYSSAKKSLVYKLYLKSWRYLWLF